MSGQLPYISINQSAICVPVTESLTFTLDIKVLPERDVPSRPFYGVWLLDLELTGEGRILACLDDKKSDVSSLCKEAIGDVLGE